MTGPLTFLPYRFRWVFCQLEVLRHCFPASIRQTLDQLPQSLDETYVRVLNQISQANQAHAHRMLQCLLVAVRPLRVEELAELLAFEFDAEQKGIPKYRAAWRLDDQTQAVLSTCSSLVTIVDDKTDWYSWPRRRRQVVQFSHFSVKEFLLSNRLTSSISRYRIHPTPAHTILTQACIGFLLHLDEDVDEESAKGFPLADYAARNWAEHAKYKDVASRVKDGMETLFDPDKPYFAAWIGIHDIDKVDETFLTPTPSGSPVIPSPPSLASFRTLPTPSLPSVFQPSLPLRFQRSLPLRFQPMSPPPDSESDSEAEISPNPGPTPSPNPLYYSVLCGFYNLTKHLVVKFPQYVNAIYGKYELPLFAALCKDHLEVGKLLLEHGAKVDAQETTGRTVLLKVISLPHHSGLADIVTLLLKHGADVNFQDRDLTNALHLAEYHGELEVARILLKYKAYFNSRDIDGNTPLHILSGRWPWIYNEDDILDHAKLLLKYGADTNSQDNRNQAPLHVAMRNERFILARILIEHGANPQAEDDYGTTPLHILSASRIHDNNALDLVWLLLGNGAEVNRLVKDKQAPLHLAMRSNWFRLTLILLDHGADANAEDIYGWTPLLLLSASRARNDKALDLVRPLLEHGAELNKRNNNGQTPLQLAMMTGWFQLARVLIDLGADVSTEDEHGRTLLHLLATIRAHESDALDLVWPLLEHGAVVNRRDKYKQTPLHLAIRRCWFQLARILLDQGANAKAEYDDETPPLHLVLSASRIYDSDALDLTFLLLEHGAEVNSQDKNKQTPLLLAMGRGWFKLAWILLERGANANAEDNNGKTPLHILSEHQIYDSDNSVLQSTPYRGADNNLQDADPMTPLRSLHDFGPVQIAQALFDRGANVNAGNNIDKAPSYLKLGGNVIFNAIFSVID